MRRVANLANLVAILLLLAGFALIFAGWSGAASVDSAAGQIPYLISGGVVGLGLVLYGATALLLRTIRQGQESQLETLRQLTQSMRRIGSPVPSTNGSSGSAHSEADFVLVGASSFHSESCRLAAGRAPIKVSRMQAEEEGLEPCRICNP